MESKKQNKCKENKTRTNKIKPKTNGGCQRGGGGMGEVGEGNQEVQTSSYRINKSQGCIIHHKAYHQLYHNNFVWGQMVTRWLTMVITS